MKISLFLTSRSSSATMARLLLTLLVVGSSWADIRPNPSQNYNSPQREGNPNNNGQSGFGASPSPHTQAQNFGNGPSNSFGPSNGQSFNTFPSNFDSGVQVSNPGNPNVTPNPLANFNGQSTAAPNRGYNGPSTNFNGPSTAVPTIAHNTPTNFNGPSPATTAGSYDRPSVGPSTAGFPSGFNSQFAGNNGPSTIAPPTGLNSPTSGYNGPSTLASGNLRGSNNSPQVNQHQPLERPNNGVLNNGFQNEFSSQLPSTGNRGPGTFHQEPQQEFSNIGGFSTNSQVHRGGLTGAENQVNGFNAGFDNSQSAGYNGPSRSPRLNQGAVQPSPNGGLFRGQPSVQDNSSNNRGPSGRGFTANGAFNGGSSLTSQQNNNLRQVNQNSGQPQTIAQNNARGSARGFPTTNQNGLQLPSGSVVKATGGKYRGTTTESPRSQTGFQSGGQSQQGFTQRQQQGTFGEQNVNAFNNGASGVFNNRDQTSLNQEQFGQFNRGSNNVPGRLPQQNPTGQFNGNLQAGNNVGFQGQTNNNPQALANSRLANGISSPPTFGQRNEGSYSNQGLSNAGPSSTASFPRQSQNGFSQSTGSHNGQGNLNGQSNGFGGSPAFTNGVSGNQGSGSFAGSRGNSNAFSPSGYGK